MSAHQNEYLESINKFQMPENSMEQKLRSNSSEARSLLSNRRFDSSKIQNDQTVGKRGTSAPRAPVFGPAQNANQFMSNMQNMLGLMKENAKKNNASLK